MSGEAGGALIGGVLLIGALPIVLGGAAAVGCVVGLAKIGSFAVEAAARRRRENALKVERCSAELSGVYSRIEAAMKRERELSLAYYRGVEKKMEGISLDIRAAAEKKPDASVIRAKAEEARREGVLAMTESREKEMSRIRRETEEVRAAVVEELEKTCRARTELADWEKETAAARAAQLSVAEDLMRDARASVALLRRLSDGDPADTAFEAQVTSLEDAYRSAEDQLKKGLCQSVAASAQRIITRSAALAIEHEEELADRDQLAVAAESALEGLRAELEALRVFKYEDEDCGEVEGDLNDFTQGAYGKLQDEIAALLARMRSDEGGGPSRLQLLELLDHVRNDLTPRADRLVSAGHERIMKFCERLRALELIAAQAEENGYEVAWIASAGDDPTQKTVVNLRDPDSGNAISVSLDDDPAGAADGMDMQVRFYYGSGRPVTEEEKKIIRDRMLSVLHEKGLMGRMTCTGSVDKAARDQSLASEKNVKALPVTEVV